MWYLPIFSGTDLRCVLRAVGLAAASMATAAAPAGTATARLPGVVWAVSGGGANSDVGFAIAVDSAGDAVLAGRVTDTATLAGLAPAPSGDLDAVVARFGADGRLNWMRRPGGADQDSAQSVGTDMRGNVLVAGFFRDAGDFGGASARSAGHRDAFVAKHDSAGSLLWLRSAGGRQIDEGRGIAADRNGNVLVTGGFEGEASFAEAATLEAVGDGDVFVAKYDPDGTLLWINQAGGSKHAWGNAVAADSASNVVVTGAYADKAVFDDTTLAGNRDLDVFVAKYNAEGKFLWAQGADGTGRDIAYSVAVDTNDNVVIVGTFSRTISFGETRLESAGRKDAFVAKYSPDGTLAWARALGGGGDDAGRAVADGGNGTLLVAGSFQGTLAVGETEMVSAGDSDVFVAAFTPDGKPMWAWSAGGPEADMAFGIAADGRGGAYVTGLFTATAAFDDIRLSSAGADDLFVAKLRYMSR